MDESGIEDERLAEFERAAVELARLAGAEIMAARGRPFEVAYKDEMGDGRPRSYRNPVTEADRGIETLVRTRLAERFPEHDVIGEEHGAHDRGHPFTWAIDPIDGTTNFVNGYPLFAASVGLLHRGVPVAGAIWCSATHALSPGVYHARSGGGLGFDGAPCGRSDTAEVRRRLVSVPRGSEAGTYDLRKSGSAAIDCAFVAVGMLAGARFNHINLWDVAAGVVLVKAAGGAIRIRGTGGWAPFRSFARDSESEPLAWRGALALAESEAAAEALTQAP